QESQSTITDHSQLTDSANAWDLPLQRAMLVNVQEAVWHRHWKLQGVRRIAVAYCAALAYYTSTSCSTSQSGKLTNGHRTACARGVDVVRHKPLQDSHVWRGNTVWRQGDVLIGQRR